MKIVLDANLIAALVLPLAYSEAATTRILAWKHRQITLAAPALWRYEVKTVLRKALVAGTLPADQVDIALEQIWAIHIEDVLATFELQQQALAWAERLGQSKTYDSAYLAAAQALQSEFWTADRRLAQSAQHAGATWVYSILES
ncbi:MAG: type II toxin-antitoxin system VapC family toxin [Anaerolineales bacterium]|nr:type II toxin-antitoxin system VapC family toxin [Anaerolineales bacterium]